MRATELTPKGTQKRTRDAFRAVLDSAVTQHLPGRTIDRVERRLAPYRSSRWLEHVTVHLDDGSVVPLVYKDAIRAVPGSDADRVKPPDVMDVGREAWVYHHILGRSGGGGRGHSGRAPNPWAVLVGKDGRPRGLLLERVDGAPLTEVGSPRAWQTAARWLAEFHACRIPSRWRSGPLLLHDRALHERWLERAGNSGALDGLDATGRSGLTSAHRTALDLALAGSTVLLHGEFYPSNVVVRRGPAGWTVHPVDWEMSGPGPAILDLAALTSGWSAGESRNIALAYLRAAESASMPSAEGLLERLTAGRLLLAVQWLGWTAEAWLPPPQHRTDWLATALECAEEFV